MKCSRAIKQAASIGEKPGELDYRLHAFTAGAAEVNLLQSPTGQPAQFRSQLTRQFRYVALEHRRTTAIQLFMQGCNNAGMIVAQVVDAITRKKVQNPPAVGRKQLRAHASRV